MTPPPSDPWQLVWGQPYIDSDRLAAAIEEDLRLRSDPDFRTRLLIRDAAAALRSYWGPSRFSRWLRGSEAREQIRQILREQLGAPGFPTIEKRLVMSVNQRQVARIFDILGQHIHRRVDVFIAGSIPTLIQGLTARPTTDIDLVDEVPAEIRKQHALLRKIEAEFGLTLGHVQSHSLPTGWQERSQFFGDFGGLRVRLLDPYDIFVSKLSSKQEKHQLDLRVLADKLDRETALARLLTAGKAFLDDAQTCPQIEANWRFIYQEPLFPAKKPPRKRKKKPE